MNFIRFFLKYYLPMLLMQHRLLSPTKHQTFYPLQLTIGFELILKATLLQICYYFEPTLTFATALCFENLAIFTTM